MDDESQKQEKPFDTVSIVLMLMLAIADDATTIVADLSLAIPIVGVVALGLSKMTEFVVWAILQSWFVLKLHSFGKPGIANLVGGLLSGAGIPATTITTIVAIYMANHPKLAAIADVASGKGVGGVTGGGDTELEARNERRREADEKRKMKGEGMSPEERRKARLVHSEEDVIAPEAGKSSEVSTERRPEPDIPSRTPSPIRGASGQTEPVEGTPETEGAPPKPQVSEEELGLKEGLGEVKEIKELERLFEEVPKAEEEKEVEQIEKRKNIIPFPAKNQQNDAKNKDDDLKKVA
jgi:hypothetical protein